MAKLNVNRSTSIASSLYRGRTTTEPTPAASPNATSDKENHNVDVSTPKTGRSDSNTMNARISRVALRDSDQGNKRRRLEDLRDIRGDSVASICPIQTLNTQYGEQEVKKESDKFYDPNQKVEYRQGLRIAIRKNHQRINENRAQLMKGGNEQLISSLKREDKLMSEVRQTSDAVLDSRYMLSIAELSSKKLADEARGKNSRGLDIEEFISKAITFMKNDGAPRDNDSIARTRRNRTQAQTQSEENIDEDDGDALEWDILGEHAAFPSNGRPAVPSFLLGPLSVEKKVRNTQATARQRRDPISALKRPEELNAKDLEKNESSNQSKICSGIKDHLKSSADAAQEAVSIADPDSMSDIEKLALFRQHHLSDNWETSLFEFAINPSSFAQSVENLFYISFLIKDGLIRLSTDGDGLPTIRVNEGETADGQRERGSQRNQAIFSLDYDSWQKLIKAFNITKPMIPSRTDSQTHVAANGWYT